MLTKGQDFLECSKKNGMKVIGCRLRSEMEQHNDPRVIVRTRGHRDNNDLGVCEEICNSHINTGVEE
jgi:hypothetical protein